MFSRFIVLSAMGHHKLTYFRLILNTPQLDSRDKKWKAVKELM